MLEIQDLDVSYNGTQVLYGVSLAVRKGEIVSILGRNGAGKSTLLKTIVGFVQPKRGSIKLNGRDITKWSLEKRTKGIGYTPDNKRLFGTLTVLENLQISALGSENPKASLGNLESILNYFPALKGMLKRKAVTLSGGEQQMLNLTRALSRSSGLFLLDEPSVGLAPAICESLSRAIVDLREKVGGSFLIVEQEISIPLKISDRIYGLLNGEIAFEGTPKEAIESKVLEDILMISKTS